MSRPRRLSALPGPLIAAVTFVPTFLAVFFSLSSLMGATERQGATRPTPALSTALKPDPGTRPAPTLSEAVRDPFVAPPILDSTPPSDPREALRGPVAEDAPVPTIESTKPWLPPAPPRVSPSPVPRASRDPRSRAAPSAAGRRPERRPSGHPRPRPPSRPAKAGASGPRRRRSRIGKRPRAWPAASSSRVTRSRSDRIVGARPWVVWIGAQPRGGERRRSLYRYPAPATPKRTGHRAALPVMYVGAQLRRRFAAAAPAPLYRCSACSSRHRRALLWSVFGVVPRISAARVLLLFTDCSVLRISCFSPSSSVVPTGSTTTLARSAGGAPSGAIGRQSARDHPVLARDHRALDDVAQLAHIARPGVLAEQLERRLVDAAHLPLVLLVELGHERLREERDVLGAPAQRRERDRQHVDPVVEILPERAVLHRLRHVLVGRARRPARPPRPRRGRRCAAPGCPAGRGGTWPAGSSSSRRSRRGRWSRRRPARSSRAAASSRR